MPSPGEEWGGMLSKVEGIGASRELRVQVEDRQAGEEDLRQSMAGQDRNVREW